MIGKPSMEKDMLKLLVITPVFNGEKYIEETINSVLNARIDSMEYLIVNDGSTDQTSRILQKFSGKIRVVNQANSGEGNAVNTGFASVDSEYIMIVSADDLINKGIFEKLIHALDENSGHAVAYPDWEMIDKSGAMISKIETQEFSVVTLYEKMKCLPGPGALIRRSSVKRSYLRDDSYVYIGDFECWLQIARDYPLLRVPENLAKWRYHGENMSIVGRNLQMAMEFIRVYKEILSSKSASSQIKRMAKRGLGTAYYTAARLVYFDEKVPARIFLARSFYWNFLLKKDVYSIGYIILGRRVRKYLTHFLKRILRSRLP
jgi:glycosyltransferase involved in cell wall biosynthesis